ncbi:unnamed protein product [Arabidopsis lyrata]|nr:unnamed protein product [Arabidopsis lyrata]
MGKRGSSSGSTKLVIESRYKGLTVEEIVDDLRSKNREYVRLRHAFSRGDNEDEGISSEEGSKNCDVEVKGPAFKDLGGLKHVLDELMFDVKFPLLCTDIVQAIALKPISGLLLYGPPGCGKPTLAYAIANENGVPFYMISASELVFLVFQVDHRRISGNSSLKPIELHLRLYLSMRSEINASFFL